MRIYNLHFTVDGVRVVQHLLLKLPPAGTQAKLYWTVLCTVGNSIRLYENHSSLSSVKVSINSKSWLHNSKSMVDSFTCILWLDWLMHCRVLACAMCAVRAWLCRYIRDTKLVQRTLVPSFLLPSRVLPSFAEFWRAIDELGWAFFGYKLSIILPRSFKTRF